MNEFLAAACIGLGFIFGRLALTRYREMDALRMFGPRIDPALDAWGWGFLAVAAFLAGAWLAGAR